MDIGPKFRHISVFHSQDDVRVFLSCVELRQPQLNKHFSNVSRISFHAYLKVVSTYLQLSRQLDNIVQKGSLKAKLESFTMGIVSSPMLTQSNDKDVKETIIKFEFTIIFNL